jgi:hypothetical protein
MLTPAQILPNRSGQRPSNKGDLDWSVTADIGRVYYAGMDLILISFCNTILDYLELRFTWHTL